MDDDTLRLAIYYLYPITYNHIPEKAKEQLSNHFVQILLRVRHMEKDITDKLPTPKTQVELYRLLGLKPFEDGDEKPPITPDHWGPAVWRFLHRTSLVLDRSSPEVRRLFAEFILNLDVFLICPNCSDSYVRLKLGVDAMYKILDGRYVQAIFDLHNAINMKRGVAVLTAEEFATLYDGVKPTS